MIVFPNCKINIGLYVTEKRSDGYHNIETCFYPIPFTDVLEILPSHKTKLTVHGTPVEGVLSDNLVLKAYHLLKNEYNIPEVDIQLLKCIPTGAGLGGGSANAAFAITLLNAMFELGISPTDMERMALKLGSDCPFFIQNKPTLAKGRGEIFEPIKLSLKGKYLQLVNPGIHINTAMAFQSIQPKRPSQPLKNTLVAPIAEWQQSVKNDFEDFAFEAYPQLASIKQKLYDQGAEYASMSGSGSTMYGIYSELPKLISGNYHFIKVLSL